MPHGNWFRFLIVCSWLILLGLVWDLGIAFLGTGEVVEDLQRAQWSPVWVSVDYAARWAVACVILVACYRLFAREAWAAKLLLFALLSVPAAGLTMGVINAGKIAQVVHEMTLESSALLVFVASGVSVALLIWIGVPALTWYYLSRPQMKQWLAEPAQSPSP